MALFDEMMADEKFMSVMSATSEGMAEMISAEADDINAKPRSRAELEAAYGQVWNVDSLRDDFIPLSFARPLMAVERRSDGQRGTLHFQDSPRYYWGFETKDMG